MNLTCDKALLRYGTVLALMFLVECIVYLAAVDMLGIETEVMRDRYWKNAYPLFHGDVPVMEYPRSRWSSSRSRACSEKGPGPTT